MTDVILPTRRLRTLHRLDFLPSLDKILIIVYARLMSVITDRSVILCEQSAMIDVLPSQNRNECVSDEELNFEEIGVIWNG